MKTKGPDERPKSGFPDPDPLADELAGDAAIGGAPDYEASIDDGRLECDRQDDIAAESDAKEGI